MDHECDSTVVPSVESIQNDKFETCQASAAFDSFRPVSDTLVWGEPLNSGPPKLRTMKFDLKKLERSLYRMVSTYLHTIILFCQGARI